MHLGVNLQHAQVRAMSTILSITLAPVHLMMIVAGRVLTVCLQIVKEALIMNLMQSESAMIYIHLSTKSARPLATWALLNTVMEHLRSDCFLPVRSSIVTENSTMLMPMRCI